MKDFLTKIFALFCAPVLVKNKLRIEIKLLVLCGLLVLAACQTAPSKKTPSVAQKPIVTRAEARILSEEAEVKLAEAEEALKEGNSNRARRQLNGVKTADLNVSQLLRFQLAKVRYYLLVDKPNLAFREIVPVGDEVLRGSSIAFQTDWFLSYAATLEAGGDIKTALRMLILMDERLSTKDSIPNQKQILRMLYTLSADTLLHEARLAPDTYMRGWYDFALLSYIDPSYSRTNTRSLWRESYPRHPGERYFSVLDSRQDELIQVSSTSARDSIHVAFLLPFSGPLASFSEAIVAGYIGIAEQHYTTVEVKRYDTNQERSVRSLYDTAVREKNSLIIGPLRKEKVARLYREVLRPAIPILAFNALPKGGKRDKFFSYNLDIERNAVFAAQAAWKNECRAMIIIRQDNELGDRASAAVEQEWRSLGGEIVKNRIIVPEEKIIEAVSEIVEVTNEEVEASKEVYRNYLFQLRKRGLEERTLNELLNTVSQEEDIPILLPHEDTQLLLREQEVFMLSKENYNRTTTTQRAAAGTLTPEILEELKLIAGDTEEEVSTQELLDNFFTEMQASYERVDANCIFLAMDSIMAVQVRPFLSFYLANDIPVYGTFLLYDRDISGPTYRDLQQVRYGELPGILGLLRNWDESLQVDSIFALRFYVRGRDAFIIGQSLPRFIDHRERYSSKRGDKTTGEYYVLGESGLLFMNDSEIITIPREVYFSAGRPRSIKYRSIFQ